jgi:hypothetical protein
MYSHGKKVDTSAIAVVYTGARELRTKLKSIVEGDTVHLIGNRYRPRAVLLPIPKNNPYYWNRDRTSIAGLRKRFAAALEHLGR